MATFYEIPLLTQNQNFRVSLAGNTYKFFVFWNSDSSSWCLDISDSNGVLILGGLVLVTGTDLLAPYAYMGFGGALVVQSDSDVDAVPGIDNLGLTSHLYFYPTPS